MSTITLIEMNDKVLISPDLTHQDEWLVGEVIEKEKNSFVGIVITVKTEDGDIFFGKAEQFKPFNTMN